MDCIWTYTSSKLVVIIPDDDHFNIDSFYFVVDLSIRVGSLPPSYLQKVVQAVSTAVSRYGLQEMTATIGGDSPAEGGFDLNLEPNLPFPRGIKPTFLIVTDEQEVALELLYIGPALVAEYLNPVLEMIERAREIIVSQSSRRLFTSVRTRAERPLDQFIFEITGSGVLPMTLMTRRIAGSVIASLMSMLAEIGACELTFNILRVKHGTRYTIGNGKLTRDLDVLAIGAGLGNSTAVQNY